MDFIRFRKNPKIFEPLKRLLGAALTYFQNYTAPHDTFCRFGFVAYRHGWWWFYAVATFWQAEPTKTRVQELTRTSILGHSHTKAKKDKAVVGVAVLPITDDAAPRVIAPTAAT